MNNKILIKLIITLLLPIFLLSCKANVPPGEYDANEVGKIKKVIPGTIISMRKVNLHNQNTDVMAQAKSSTEGFMNSGYNQTRGVEYVIKLHSGSIISVVQAEDLKLRNKQKILVIYGRTTRVVADNGSDIY